MQVWGAGARGRARVATLFGVGGVAGLMAGGLIAGLLIVALLIVALANSAHSTELTPAQTVALRFPVGWAAPSASPSKAAPVATRAAAVQLSASDIFNPYPTYLPRPAQSSGNGLPQTALAYADPVSEPATESRRPTSSYQLASATPAPERRAAEPQRPATPRGAVLNAAQIASIKERLNLTPSQQRMWPEVEAALRDLVYKKTASAASKSTAVLDPASAEVARLKAAAVPLVMSFNSEQRNELRALAHLIGLGSLATQF
jgi:hypothetical protein